MDEIWKDVEGYEGIYKVSSLGNVKKLNYKNSGKEQNISLCNDADGYLLVNLRLNNKSKSKRVHRLVAQAFIPNPDNKPQVNHIDGDKQNNKIENLEWVTPLENNKHAWDTGLKKPPTEEWKLNHSIRMSGEKHPNYGIKMSEEIKQKISEANKGKPSPMKGKKLSKESREKISITKLGKISPMKGKKLSQESRKKISVARSGKKMSDESKAKISNSLKGKFKGEKHPMYRKFHTEETKNKMRSNRKDSKSVICVTTNEVFVSMMDAERILGVKATNISKACRGEAKSAGKHPDTGEKLIWKFK